MGLKVPETIIQIEAISEHIVGEITNLNQKLRRTTQILLEQSKDAMLLQSKQKLKKRNIQRKSFNRAFGLNTIYTIVTD